jgi:hypothetical protein
MLREWAQFWTTLYTATKNFDSKAEAGKQLYSTVFSILNFNTREFWRRRPSLSQDFVAASTLLMHNEPPSLSCRTRCDQIYVCNIHSQYFRIVKRDTQPSQDKAACLNHFSALPILFDRVRATARCILHTHLIP